MLTNTTLPLNNKRIRAATYLYVPYCFDYTVNFVRTGHLKHVFHIFKRCEQTLLKIRLQIYEECWFGSKCGLCVWWRLDKYFFLRSKNRCSKWQVCEYYYYCTEKIRRSEWLEWIMRRRWILFHCDYTIRTNRSGTTWN